MIKYRQNPVKDYLAVVARTIFVLTRAGNGTTPAEKFELFLILL
jgi:hypothetical protein